MKNKVHIINCLIFTFIIFFPSCNDESTNPIVHTPFVTGYSATESSECMTLSSLAYVNENNPSYIKDSLIIQLSNISYATQGKWKLDWGPGLNSDNSNMMFIVKDTTTNPDRYTIAIRGTDWCYFYDWKEDLKAISFTPYTYGPPGDSVSYGAWLGLTELLSMRDPLTNKTLIAYLNNISGTSNQMYITGHSLGGQLATILSAWFLDNGYSSKFNLKAYTFAAPSTGNEAFLEHYTTIFSMANAESYRVFNPLDLIPNFCATLDTVIQFQIPTQLPIEVKGVIGGLQEYFNYNGMVYKNVGTRYELGTIFPALCNYTPGSFDQYECWVNFEHSFNTYLTLLNAPNTYFYFAPCDWGKNK